jgi:hypothetical protein
VKMKRTQKLGVKRERGKRPRDREQPPRSSDLSATTSAHDLPPNNKLRKFADEIYGDTEIPKRERRPLT